MNNNLSRRYLCQLRLAIFRISFGNDMIIIHEFESKYNNDKRWKITVDVFATKKTFTT